MGNCISHSHQNIDGRGIEIDRREIMEIDGSYIVISRKVHNGEVYNIEPPFLRKSVKTTSDNRNMKRRNLKIVVTMEQLKLMLNGSNKFKIKTRVAHVSKKWLPSLPTIHEVQNS
ncbi:hypothetical protein Lal_00044032 [Lupinus albus]|uniref:Uncharacterized protein n=1 Tax=Lupinus albus TaxID=3870 RepID=A0A6A5PED4_LUPAL|nr:hypothetical protein Lalb_Chr15g0088141 [Lupinus albus]KAF1895382.1 hypothetical protein Lal_00044032 [Lupinus albus]